MSDDDVAPLMFVFLDVRAPYHIGAMFDRLGMRLVENQFHPPHEHHGLLKYDTGNTIVSLNLFAERPFLTGESDGLTMCFRTRDHDHLPQALAAYGSWSDSAIGPVFTDDDGHHYRFEPGGAGDSRTIDLTAIRLVVPDLDGAITFYRDAVGFPLIERTPGSARFGTGTADLYLDESDRAVDGWPVRHRTYLLVLHAHDVEAAARALAGRGLPSSAGFSDIGGTARFRDLSGHTFCLYEPSPESLTWGSGRTVRRLAARHRQRTDWSNAPC